jgi:site-specific recombinase XerD
MTDQDSTPKAAAVASAGLTAPEEILTGEVLPVTSGSEQGITSANAEADATVPPRLADAVRENLEDARAANTRRAYNSDVNQFDLWCRNEKRQALPATPATVAAYITDLALKGRKPATIQRALAAISQAHKLAGHVPAPTADPKVHEVLKGIRNREGAAQKQAHPFTPDDVRRHAGLVARNLRGLRDHAMLTVGVAGGFRRHEMIDLDIADLEDHPGQGYVALVRRSKTDQAGEGRRVELAFGDFPDSCPVRALRAWLDAAKIVEGAVFREITVNGELTSRRASTQAVGRCAKRVAALLGYNEVHYSGHSFRSSYVTAAKRAGKSDAQIMRQTGHRSRAMMDKYDRQAMTFMDSPSKGIGL